MKKGFGFHESDPAEVAPHISATRSRVVRFEIHWAAVEPQRGQYDQTALAGYDRMVQAILERDATPIILFGYPVPEWARAWSHPTAPPADPAELAHFARFLAQRYPKVRGLEVWNEGNQAQFWGDRDPDPSGYARLLTAAYTAIKSVANTRVLSAGTASVPANREPQMVEDWRYIRRFREAGGKCDVIAFHAYESLPRYVDDRIRRIRDVAGKKPLACTEFGYSVCTVPRPPCVSEPQQAGGITGMLNHLDGKVTDATVYTLRDSLPDDSIFGRFGLCRRDWTKRASWFALRDYNPR